MKYSHSTNHLHVAHTYQDVAAAVELAVNIYLREGWPLAVLLHAAAQTLILQNVDRRERRLQLVQYLRGWDRGPVSDEASFGERSAPVKGRHLKGIIAHMRVSFAARACSRVP